MGGRQANFPERELAADLIQPPLRLDSIEASARAGVHQCRPLGGLSSYRNNNTRSSGSSTITRPEARTRLTRLGIQA